MPDADKASGVYEMAVDAIRNPDELSRCVVLTMVLADELLSVEILYSERTSGKGATKIIKSRGAVKLATPQLFVGYRY